MRQIPMPCCALALAASLFGQTTPQPVTVPATAAGAEAPVGEPFLAPHSIELGANALYVYPQPTLASFATGRITITRLRFRADGGLVQGGGAISLALPRLTLGHATRAHTNLSTSYRANYHHSETYSLATPLTANATTGSTPNDDLIDITLPRPFTYDPSLGTGLAVHFSVIMLDPTWSAPALDMQNGYAAGGRVYGSYLPGNESIDGRVPVMTVDYIVGGSADSRTFGVGCGQGTGSTFAEAFSPALPFDLSGSSWLATPARDTYSVRGGSEAIVAPTGAPLALNDDDVQTVALPWTMPSLAGPVSQIVVCSNGWISFEPSAAGTSAGDVEDLLVASARVCPLWADFDPTAGGSIHAEADPVDPDLFHVTWDNVTVQTSGGTGTGTMQVSLHSSGEFEAKYGSVATPARGVTGFSIGNGAPSPSHVDISTVIPGLWIPSTDTRALELRPSARPVMGTTIDLDLDEIPSTATSTAMLFAFSNVASGIDLTVAGMTGCRLYTGSVFATAALPPPSLPSQSLSLALPTDPVFAGVDVTVQAAVSNHVAVNPLPVATSNAVELTIDIN